MMGKLFLFALVCVSFAQGLELEEAIKRGLVKAESLEQYGKDRTEAAFSDINRKSERITYRTDDFVRRVQKRQADMRQGLRTVALMTEKQAREDNAPKSVFQCISKEETLANSQAESLAKKFEADIRALEKAKRAEIKADTKPLDGMRQSLEVRYQEAVKMISSCQDEDCVNTNVNSFVTWLDRMLDDITRIRKQVTTIFGSFQNEANTLNDNTIRQFPRIDGIGARNIRTCLEKKEGIFGEN